jgi:hypothetical protein
MKKEKKQDQEARISRRALFGALAGVAAAITALRRKQPGTVAGKHRRRPFWIGHT